MQGFEEESTTVPLSGRPGLQVCATCCFRSFLICQSMTCDALATAGGVHLRSVLPMTGATGSTAVACFTAAVVRDTMGRGGDRGARMDAAPGFVKEARVFHRNATSFTGHFDDRKN
jgi:hypothetical protein